MEIPRYFDQCIQRYFDQCIPRYFDQFKHPNRHFDLSDIFSIFSKPLQFSCVCGTLVEVSLMNIEFEKINVYVKP